MRRPPCLLLALACFATAVRADVSLNNMFGDHMVLQQGIKNKVWGRAEPGEAVTVTLGTQSHSTKAAGDGAWHVFLDPVVEYGGPHTLTVKGRNTVTFDDVLIGEVWVCSGQSNMWWSVNRSKDPDIETATAKYPNIRLITVPAVAAQKPQWNFAGAWQTCSPETVGDFSAVGYFFGRQLHQTLGVPVGLIDNAWGGSAAEAWVRRDKLAAHPRLKAIHDRWLQLESADKPDEKKMPIHQRPANIHCGVLSPSIGYGIRGVIWYQGEANVGRAHQYRELFPFMITSWREEWGLGDFPFYWAQLAAYKEHKSEPGDSEWAELREAQTMTMKSVPNGGEAVIIDIGEGKDIHPKNKQDVAKRLARWALAETYKLPGIACRSPLHRALERAAAGCSFRSRTSPAAGGRSASLNRWGSRSPAPTGSSFRPRLRLPRTAGSRSGATRCPSRWPSATPGPTIRRATCIQPPACP
jgi:sialate O-acetylesterase